MVSKLLLVRCRPSRTNQPNLADIMWNMANDHVPSSLRRALPDFFPTIFAPQATISSHYIEDFPNIE